MRCENGGLSVRGQGVPALGAVLSSDATVVGGAELRRATHLLMELQLADTRVTGELLEVGLPGLARHCPGRNPPFLAVKRPARPYKSPIQTRFPVEIAEGA